MMSRSVLAVAMPCTSDLPGAPKLFGAGPPKAVLPETDPGAGEGEVD